MYHTKPVFWQYLPNLECRTAVDLEWNPQFAQIEMNGACTKYCTICIPVVETQ